MKPDIWMNGQFVPWDEACIHPLSHSLQRGSTLFESIDCNETFDGRTAIFRLNEHIRRFETSSEIVGMPLPYDTAAIRQAIIDTVARSGLKNCTIRPLAFQTAPILDLYPGDAPVTMVIGIGEMHGSSGGYRVKISPWRKINSSCMPVKAKVSGNYITSLLAKAEAIKAGFNDAILLDSEGFVAEATTANIFIVEGGQLVTAPEDTILLGVTRDSIMQLSGELGIGFVRDKFGPERLMNADEVILCSSGNEVKPIIQVGDRVIGDGAAGPVTRRLAAFYAEVIVGRVEKFKHWLTYV
jgi:branched-chain amino acid aminotransferase